VLVSDFEIRISDFLKAAVRIADRYAYRGLKCEFSSMRRTQVVVGADERVER
jgi:hypothetical protein